MMIVVMVASRLSSCLMSACSAANAKDEEEEAESSPDRTVSKVPPAELSRKVLSTELSPEVFPTELSSAIFSEELSEKYVRNSKEVGSQHCLVASLSRSGSFNPSCCSSMLLPELASSI